MKQPISIVRGTTNFFQVDIVDQNGDEYLLKENETLVFAVKANPTDIERLIVKTLPASSKYIFTLNPDDTTNLEPGRYVYDVGLQVGEQQFYNIIESSLFEIKPNVAELGDGS